MFTKFSLWMSLMVRWMRSSKECRKLRYQRDVLYKNAGFSLYSFDAPPEWDEVMDQIVEELECETPAK